MIWNGCTFKQPDFMANSEKKAVRLLIDCLKPEEASRIAFQMMDDASERLQKLETEVELARQEAQKYLEQRKKIA